MGREAESLRRDWARSTSGRPESEQTSRSSRRRLSAPPASISRAARSASGPCQRCCLVFPRGPDHARHPAVTRPAATRPRSKKVSGPTTRRGCLLEGGPASEPTMLRRCRVRRGDRQPSSPQSVQPGGTLQATAGVVDVIVQRSSTSYPFRQRHSPSSQLATGPLETWHAPQTTCRQQGASSSNSGAQTRAGFGHGEHPAISAIAIAAMMVLRGDGPPRFILQAVVRVLPPDNHGCG